MKLETLLDSPVALPSMPRVVSLLLAELDLDEPDIRKVNELMNFDPVLTARLLQLSNSAKFQLPKRIGSVREALSLLGVTLVKNLVTVAALGSSFRKIPGIDMSQFWLYSLNVSKVSSVLAGMVKIPVSVSYTAGLIHAMGELVLHLADMPQIAELDASVSVFDPARSIHERELLGYNYAQVGAGFARAWHFPQAIIEGLEHQDRPFENHVYEPLSGVLHLAAWRARTLEMAYSPAEMVDNFPDEVALALELDIDMVLACDPQEWTSRQEVAVFS
jgi:HD-like signal output (HDOD) protein